MQSSLGNSFANKHHCLAARWLAAATVLFLASWVPRMPAQTVARAGPDLAVTFSAQRSLRVSDSETFWAKGGGVELGVDAWRGLGIAANITGVQTSSIGSSGIPLSIVTATFGPRYRWHGGQRTSLFGEALLGEADAFNSLFPSTFGAQSDASSMALRLGGGVDVGLHRHFAVRVVDAAWVRTQLPNSVSDVQNSLHLGAGLVFRFGS